LRAGPPYLCAYALPMLKLIIEPDAKLLLIDIDTLNSNV